MSLAELRKLEEQVLGLQEVEFPWDASEQHGPDLSKSEIEKLRNAPWYNKYRDLGVVSTGQGERGGFEFAVSYRKSTADADAQAKKEFDSWYAKNKDSASGGDAKIFKALSNWVGVDSTASGVRQVQFKVAGGGVGLQSTRASSNTYAGVVSASEIKSQTGLSVSQFVAWLTKNGAKAVKKLGETSADSIYGRYEVVQDFRPQQDSVFRKGLVFDLVPNKMGAGYGPKVVPVKGPWSGGYLGDRQAKELLPKYCTKLS